MAELVWEGKYKDGKKVAPLKIALPFQTVETVNESAADRARTRSLFDDAPREWRNRLIWGDKRYVLPSLLPEFAGQVNLIYIDPPFDTGADFSFTAQIPDDPDTPGDQSATFLKQPSILELKAYRDIWGGAATHLDAYLKWFYETAVLLYELLDDTGSLYVHLAPNVSHYVKAVLDEIFGYENFKNDVIWKRTSAHGNVKARYAAVQESILFYTKSDKWTWNNLRASYSEDYIESHYSQVEAETGRRFTTRDLTASMSRASRGQLYAWKGFTPPSSRCWAFTQDKMQQFEDAGLLVYSPRGMPRLKLYLDEMSGTPLDSIWTDLPPINSQSAERLAYPTQKPEALLERILKASSNEGDLVLDCFCGSGTTAAVAEKLKRRWITCDLGRFAVHTARKRLLEIPHVRPFEVQNLGKYERQAWTSAEFGERSAELAEAQKRYRNFILELYRAQPLDGYLWLHGVKAGRFVHVGSVDAPVTEADLKQIANEFRRARGQDESGGGHAGIDVLGWDFAFEINDVARDSAAAAGIAFRPRIIPREVMEKRAAEQGDVQFFEPAALEVAATAHERTVTIALENFTIPPDYVPADVQKGITHWEQTIDYWAIDWDHGGALSGDTFHNQWQSYRTRAKKTLERSARHTYEAPGSYFVMVKVIDILGNDTTKTLRVEVK